MPNVRAKTLRDDCKRYWFRVDTGRGPDGERLQEFHSYERHAEAVAELARIMTERRRGVYVRPSDETVGELIDDYLQSATFEREAATARS